MIRSARTTFRVTVGVVLLFVAVPVALKAQDPAEPPGGKPVPRLLPSPAGAVKRSAVDQAALRAIVQELVSCGTRSSLSSWTDPKRGIGCGRDKVLARFRTIARATGGRLQVSVDRFQVSMPRAGNKPVPLENVLAILPGSDPALRKTAFIVSGDFDSRPSNGFDPNADAPGADDDASGVAVALECARLLGRGTYRATLIFTALSGEEQGLFGAKRLLAYLNQNGYTVGGYLDNDIVGADFAPGGPHRARVFSGGGPDGIDSPSRELARSVEVIDGVHAIRMIFRIDRLGRGGDHMPFIQAGLPAVRFTEPLEDYHHEHQTPRVENGARYGDLLQFLNYRFMATVTRDNAEVLRELALAPAPPAEVALSGAVTPDAKLSWSAPSDPKRAGFEILWRETTSPRWQVFDFITAPAAAGAAGALAWREVLHGVSTDNHFFAVRSVGRNGARSIPAAAEPARRR